MHLKIEKGLTPFLFSTDHVFEREGVIIVIVILISSAGVIHGAKRT